MRLPKARRMSRSGEFRLVREQGESYRGRLLVLGVKKEPEGKIPSVRCGFITTKRLGGAVVRNRMRRRMRALVQEWGECIRPGHYLVLIARQSAVDADADTLRKEWKWLLQRAKLLIGPGAAPP